MTIKILIPTIVAILLTLFNPLKAEDFEVIKERVVTELLKTPIDDQSVEAILGRMAMGGSFRAINYDELSRAAGFLHQRHTAHSVIKQISTSI